MKWKMLVGLILAFFGFMSIVYYVVQSNAIHDPYVNVGFLLLGLISVVAGLFMMKSRE